MCSVGAVLLGGCAVITHPPVKEYTLAQTAMKYAKAAKASHYSSAYWHKAERSYRRAKRHYKEGRYEEAREMFYEARMYAEKAENKSRLVQHKNN